MERECDYTTTYDKFRDMLTKVFCLLVTRSQLSINQLLTPGTVLSGLLDDLKKPRILTFPTSAQLRDAVTDPGIAMDPENEASRFVENSDRRLFQWFQGLFRCTLRFCRHESLIIRVLLCGTDYQIN